MTGNNDDRRLSERAMEASAAERAADLADFIGQLRAIDEELATWAHAQIASNPRTTRADLRLALARIVQATGRR